MIGVGAVSAYVHMGSSNGIFFLHDGENIFDVGPRRRELRYASSWRLFEGLKLGVCGRFESSEEKVEVVL